MKKELLSLIGCGWLGKPLAQNLQRSGHNILATTSHDKSAEFAADGVPYITLDVGRDPVPESIRHCDVLIYMVPPLQLSLIKHFFDQIPEDKKIIFISSTSVYGKNLGAVDEENKIHTSTASSPLLVETEDYLIKRFPHITVLRFGGLYGDKRHPVYFLQGKPGLTGGNAFLHLVHRDDCIKAIRAVMETSSWGEIFNILSDVKFKKNEYYTMMAKKLGLTPPEYLSEENKTSETLISNTKSKMKLKMTYLDPSEFCTFSE